MNESEAEPAPPAEAEAAPPAEVAPPAETIPSLDESTLKAAFLKFATEVRVLETGLHASFCTRRQLVNDVDRREEGIERPDLERDRPLALFCFFFFSSFTQSPSFTTRHTSSN